MFNVQYLKHSNSVQIYLFIAITLFIFSYLFYNENENHTKKCLKNFLPSFFFLLFSSIKKKSWSKPKKNYGIFTAQTILFFLKKDLMKLEFVTKKNFRTKMKTTLFPLNLNSPYTITQIEKIAAQISDCKNN